jgi:hypothetical protein
MPRGRLFHLPKASRISTIGNGMEFTKPHTVTFNHIFQCVEACTDYCLSSCRFSKLKPRFHLPIQRTFSKNRPNPSTSIITADLCCNSAVQEMNARDARTVSSHRGVVLTHLSGKTDMSLVSRSSGAAGIHRGDVNMALAMEAHGITFNHLIPPKGDRLLPDKPWGKVLHRRTRTGAIRPVFPHERRGY